MRFVKRLAYAVTVPSAALCLGFGYLNLQYSSMMRPPAKIQTGTDKTAKERKIAIVGAGIIGLSTAYYLAQNPKNKIVIVERNKKPY